jgi:hypothetical protein
MGAAAKDALEALKDVAEEDDDKEVQAKAAIAIEVIQEELAEDKIASEMKRDRAEVEKLLARLKNKSAIERQRALKALRSKRSKVIIIAQLNTLARTDPDEDVRDDAEELVDQIYRDQQKAITEIEKLGGGVFGEKGGGLYVNLFLRDVPFGENRTRGIAQKFADLHSLIDLRGLSLGHSRVSKLGLLCIQGLPNLRSLDLSYTNLNDAGLAPLKNLGQLEKLDLRGSRVSDKGLAYLKGMSKLRVLILKDTQIGDAGLANLKSLRNLNTLNLENTKVTNAGLASLSSLTKLEFLNLVNTKLTDAGLAQLKSLTALKQLFLGRTKVTKSGVEELRKSLQTTQIFN